MAGLHSQNISVASTRAPRSAYGGGDGGSTSATRSTCVFCGRKSQPPLSDPHAPVFALFSLVDCPHYACQPCALVNCDNAGRAIECPTCHCVSRLAQTGKKRSASKKARDDEAAATAAGQRVGLDDGVSSVGSRGSRASGAARVASTAPRSALKKNAAAGSAKKRASSVQFPTDLGSRAGSSDGEEAGGTSPLTADAVKALPVDPQHAAKTRGRRAEVTSDAGSSDHAVGLYSLSTKKPKPHRSSSSTRRKPPLPPSTTAGTPATSAAQLAAASGGPARDRPQSLPPPELANRVLPPPEPFVAPPPLRLHTVEEDEMAIEATVPSPPPTDDAEPELAPVAAEETAVAAVRQLQQEEATACLGAEREERDIIEAAWRHSFKKLQVAKDDDWTAVNTRRELEDDFALSPGGTPSPLTHANNTSLQTAPSTAATPTPAVLSAAGARPHTGDEAAEEEATEDTAGKPTSVVPTPAETTTTTSTRPTVLADTESASTRAKTPDESQVSATSDEASQPSSASKDSSSKVPASGRRKKHKTATSLDKVDTVSAGTSPIPEPLEDDDDDDADEADTDRVVVDEADSLKDEPTVPGSVVSDITSVARSEALAKIVNATLQLEQLEAVERYAIADVEAAVRQHYDQLIDHIDESLAQDREAHAQDVARAIAAEHSAAKDGVARAEEADRAALDVAQTRAWGQLGQEEADDRVYTARAAAQREQDELRAAQAEAALWRCEDADEPEDRHDIQRDEHTARAALQHHADTAVKALVTRQRSQQAQRDLARLDELHGEEEDDRYMLREAERVDRRELHATLLYTLAGQRRVEAYAHEAWMPSPPEHGPPSAVPHDVAVSSASLSVAPRPAETSLSDPFTGSGLSTAVEQLNRTQPALSHQEASSSSPMPHTPSPTTAATAASYQTPTEHLTRQLQEAERYYQDEIGTAYARLREAQRHLQEEALAREQAERAREAAESEADRLVEAAQRHAEDRIRQARLVTEQELNDRLDAVRSESERRVAHEATLRALQEEEHRAVLEVRLMAAQRALDDAQQRALDDVHRAREEAAVQAAAEAARAERQAREREAELEGRLHAENMLRLAQQAEERERAAEQLRYVEQRANEAVQRAREEAQQAAADAQARVEALQSRQSARAADVQAAQAQVHQALEDIRVHETSSRTSPVNLSAYSNASSAAARSAAAAGRGVGGGAMDGYNTSTVSTVFVGRPSAAGGAAVAATPPGYVGVQPRPPEASPPPRFSPPRPVVMAPQPQQPPLSTPTDDEDWEVEDAEAVAEKRRRGAAQQGYVPSGVTSEHNNASSRTSPVRASTLPPRPSTPREPSAATTGTILTPRTMVSTIVEPMFAHFQELTDRLIQNTIREAARELDAARLAAQALRDQADQRLQESARRQRRRRVEYDRVAQDLSQLTHQTSLTSSAALAGAASGARSPRSGATALSDAAALDRSDVSGSAYFRDAYAAADASSGAARTLFFDQPSPLQPRGHASSQQQQQQQPSRRGQAGRPQYYQPSPFPYVAARHPEALLAGHRYFFQRAGPFTAGMEEAPAPIPSVPLAEPAGQSPPPRRSQTRVAAEPVMDDAPQQQQQPSQQQPRPVSVRMDFSPGPPSSTALSTSIGSSSVVPQASPVCMRCYRDDTTSPCWQCGAMVCRRCGPPAGPHKLCCAAHFRGLKRAHRAAKVYQAEVAAHQQHKSQHSQQPSQQQQPSSARAVTQATRKRTKATSPIPIQTNTSSDEDVYTNQPDDVRSSDGDSEAVAMLPDTYASSDSSFAHGPHITDHAAVAPQEEPRRVSQVRPSQYRVQHPPPPTSTQAHTLSPSYTATPSREAVGTQTSADFTAAFAEKDGMPPPYEQHAPHAAVAPSQAHAASAAEAATTPLKQTAQGRLVAASGGAALREAEGPNSDADDVLVENENENEDDNDDPRRAEPKTEKKKSYGLFFVPLDAGGDGEPRRAKPPTPRNYQPHFLSPRSEPPQRQPRSRRASPQQQQQQQSQRHYPHDYEPREARVQPVSVSQRQPRRSPQARRAGPSPSSQRTFGGVAPARHRSQEPRLHVYPPGPRLRSAAERDRVEAPPAPPVSYSARRPLPASQAIHPAQPPSYTHKARSANTPMSSQYGSAPVAVDDTLLSASSSPPSSAVVRAAADLLASRQRVPRGLARPAEQEPRTCGKAAMPSAAGTDEYHSYASEKDRAMANPPALNYRAEEGRGRRYQDVRPSKQPAPAPSAGPAYADHGRSSAPTLEELDRRLRQLRAEDRQSSERYYAQQQQQRPRALYNPDVYVHMMMPSTHGGSRSRSRGRSDPASAAAVSPPWRTDANSPAVQPPWNRQQPRSPLYRPSAYQPMV